MLTHMRRHLPFLLLASLGVLGCGNHVSQTELNDALSEVRADSVVVATDRAVAVHECSMTRSFAQRAAQQCYIAQMHGAARENVGICMLLSTWEAHCLAEDDEGNLVVPQAGVINALDTLMQRLEAEEGDSETESTPTTN